MIWYKISPAVTNESRYYNVFEYMFIISKGKTKTLNFLCDRKNKKPGHKNLYEPSIRSEKHKYSQKIRITKEYGRRFNVWQIPSKGYKKHPAAFSDVLAKDHVFSWSNENDIVLDPFMGSGTVGEVCKLNNRKFIGFEIDNDYFELAKQRIEGS